MEQTSFTISFYTKDGSFCYLLIFFFVDIFPPIRHRVGTFHLAANGRLCCPRVQFSLVPVGAQGSAITCPPTGKNLYRLTTMKIGTLVYDEDLAHFFPFSPFLGSFHFVRLSPHSFTFHTFGMDFLCTSSSRFCSSFFYS